jgi:ribonuclease D
LSTEALITDRAGVESVVAACRQAGRFALDFEFLWERTYKPIPCLAQVATDTTVWLIDPIAGAPIEPIVAIVEDPDVETLMHAPSADLTLMALHYGVQPTNILDVQLIAGFIGLGAGQSLGTLLERGLGLHLAKAESYSDWSRRPLNESQLDYAADDVRHLMRLRDHLEAEARTMGRWEWVLEEHRLRYGPDARFVTDPDEAWRKLKGQGRLSGKERNVLGELAAWREREALRRDRPPSWILADRLVIDIAKRKPTNREGLSRVRGLDEKMRDNEAGELLTAVARGLDAPIKDAPTPMRPDLAQRLSVLGALGQLLVGVRADAAGLAAPLIATRDDVESFVAARLSGDGARHPLGSGWRKELAGDALAALADGRLAIAPSPNPPYLVEIDQPG